MKKLKAKLILKIICKLLTISVQCDIDTLRKADEILNRN